MEDAYPKAIIQGIADEIYAARAFLRMAEQSKNVYMQRDCVRYAAQESDHARILLDLLTEIYDGQAFQLPSIPLLELSDPLAFLIEYQAKEEAALFYYKSLIELSEIEAHRQIFQQIYAEEENHFIHLKQIIDRQIKIIKEGNDE